MRKQERIKPLKKQRKQGKQTKHGRGSLFKKIFLSFLLTGFLGVLFVAIYVLRLDAWHAFEPDRIWGAKQSTLVYDRDGEEVSCLSGVETRIWIPLNQIPYDVQHAFIAAEDIRFYDHSGVDVIRILGAAWEDIKAGGYVQGASTISQQLIKLSHLNNEKVMERKMGEAVLAYQMEKRYTKEEILEMYLNYVYFGGGFYGVEAAARGYFGVSAKDLTLAQGAMLAGILKSPSRYAPHLHMDNSVGRRNVVLGQMREYGYIDEKACRKARSEKVKLENSLNEDKRGFYVDTALQQACSLLDVSMQTLLEGGYRIHTAMDTKLQEACEAMMLNEEFFPEEAEGVEAALVVVNVSDNGVAALMGGRQSTTALGYNRAIRIRRQPGSVIKPIIAYAPALEYEGYTTVSMLLDQVTDFNGYQPSNFGSSYKGWVTMREAVAQSLNVPAVKVFDEIGVGNGKHFAQQLGIEFDMQDTSLALALGGFTYGVSPYQIAGAYAAFASGGVYSTPSFITCIADSAGEVLYEYQPEETRVMSEGNAYILTDMLKSAIQEGTGRRLKDIGIDIAGKTGTTGDGSGNRDAWMAAYNPEYAAAVWMGYDESGQLPQNATGGTYPAMLLKNVFQTIYEEPEAAPTFAMPESVVEIRLDGHTLRESHAPVLATALTPANTVVREVFVSGTEPQSSSEYWVVPSPPTLFTVEIGVEGFPVISFSPEKDFVVYRLYRENARGETIVLSEWAGSLNTIRYIDQSAVGGETYSYYVLPEHPQLKINEMPVVGPATRSLSIDVPHNPFMNDIVLQAG